MMAMAMMASCLECSHPQDMCFHCIRHVQLLPEFIFPFGYHLDILRDFGHLTHCSVKTRAQADSEPERHHSCRFCLQSMQRVQSSHWQLLLYTKAALLFVDVTTSTTIQRLGSFNSAACVPPLAERPALGWAAPRHTLELPGLCERPPST